MRIVVAITPKSKLRVAREIDATCVVWLLQTL